MKILVTGDKGYIGSRLVEFLENKKFNFCGIDNDYFEDCTFKTFTQKRYNHIKKDIRELESKDIKGFNCVIHLAALSNDPLGELSHKLTEEINYEATINLAELSKKNGVSRFIYLSTQSIYGISDNSFEVAEEDKKNPITSYAITKWKSEIKLKKLCDENFTIVFLRPSTVFGKSPRLRCDIIYNNFIASAIARNKIEILSNGKPWRPIIHVDDVCLTILTCINIDKDKISGQAFNIGIMNENYTVSEIANFASMATNNTKIIYSKNPSSDERSYKVSFNKIYDVFNTQYKPKFDLILGGAQLVTFLKENNFNVDDFNGELFNRLRKLKNLIDRKKINHHLEWLN